MYSVPVHCDAHGGRGLLHGVLQLEDGGVRLQYQTGDAVLRAMQSPSQEMLAGFDALASVRYRAGFLWMSPRIELEFSDFQLVSRVPAGYSGTLVLKVPRDSRAVAKKLVEALDRELSFRRTLQLEQDIGRLSRADPRALAGARAEAKAEPAPPASDSSSALRE